MVFSAQCRLSLEPMWPSQHHPSVSQKVRKLEKYLGKKGTSVPQKIRKLQNIWAKKGTSVSQKVTKYLGKKGTSVSQKERKLQNIWDQIFCNFLGGKRHLCVAVSVRSIREVTATNIRSAQTIFTS